MFGKINFLIMLGSSSSKFSTKVSDNSVYWRREKDGEKGKDMILRKETA